MQTVRFTLTLAVLLAGLLPSATADPKSPVGTNLGAGIYDWAADQPFVDHFKQARPWFSASQSSWETTTALSVDANGNVKSLLSGQWARTVLFAGRPADPALSRKQFYLLYTGSGDIQYGNVDVLERMPGRDKLQLRAVTGPDSDLILILTITRTLKTTPLRDFRLVPAAGGVCAGDPYTEVASAAACASAADFRSYLTHHASILFMPHFLAGLRPYRLLRFMDWLRTNNAPAPVWTRRALPAHQFWSTPRGAPLEVCLALANALGAHPWLNIPHLATNTWVTSFAALVKQQLAPGLLAHIEYSNEVWNGQFDQTWYAYDQGKRLKLDPDAWTALVKFYSQRSQEVFTIFQQQFGGTSRLKRVMATQAVVPYFTEKIMSHKNARQLTDLFAIAPYFGATFTEAAQASELLRLGADGVFAWLNSGAGSNNILGYGSLGDIDAAVAAQANLLRDKFGGLPLTSYEGGQHLLATGGARSAAVNALLDAVNRDPRMKGTYLAYLSAWRARTGHLLNHYVHCDSWSEWGRWGAKEYPSQPLDQAPKLAALLEYAAQQPLDALYSARKKGGQR